MKFRKPCLLHRTNGYERTKRLPSYKYLRYIYDIYIYIYVIITCISTPKNVTCPHFLFREFENPDLAPLIYMSADPRVCRHF